MLRVRPHRRHHGGRPVGSDTHVVQQSVDGLRMLMVRAGSSSGVSRPVTGFAWILPTAALAVCTAIAVSVVSSGARAPVAWCGVAATALVALASAEAVRRGRALSELR